MYFARLFIEQEHIAMESWKHLWFSIKICTHW
jgi:hypothetical protein